MNSRRMNLIRSKNMWIALLAIPLSFCGESDRSLTASQDQHMNIQAEFPQLKEASGGLSYHSIEVQTGVQFLLPAFSLWYDDMIQVPCDGYRLCNAMVKDFRHHETLLYQMFRLLGAPSGGYGPPIAEARTLTPVINLHFIGEGEKNWAMLPMDLREKIEIAIRGWMEAEIVLQQFIEPVVDDLNKDGEAQKVPYMELLMEPWESRQLTGFFSIDLIGKADLRKLSFASRLMASSLSGLINLTMDPILAGFEGCIMESGIGKVGIFGSGADTIHDAYGLLIDLGGDDLYLGNIASPSQGGGDISVVVDIAGNDTYQPGDNYLVNGCLGIGMLFDLSGNDRYLSERAGIASACYGTSMLYDRLGDDFYQSNSAFSQGAAHLGSALLMDLDGNDEYLSSGYSQGYGGTLGVGVLLDLGGNDRYSVSPHNSSFIQGAGRGRWAEATDGHSLGGGLGIFIDGGGSDNYHAESFSQGASYFTGMGLFFDLEGDDCYNAQSHSQGYAAHYALAGFYEMSGDDHYNSGSDFARITQSMGGGRDLSSGWFIEAKGDDTYHFGNRSAGIGDLNGIGILWDQGGDDSYVWHQNKVNPGSPSLGQTLELSEGMAMGPRLSGSSLGEELGLFRDDHLMKLVIRKNQ